MISVALLLLPGLGLVLSECQQWQSSKKALEHHLVILYFHQFKFPLTALPGNYDTRLLYLLWYLVENTDLGCYLVSLFCSNSLDPRQFHLLSGKTPTSERCP